MVLATIQRITFAPIDHRRPGVLTTRDPVIETPMTTHNIIRAGKDYRCGLIISRMRKSRSRMGGIEVRMMRDMSVDMIRTGSKDREADPECKYHGQGRQTGESRDGHGRQGHLVLMMKDCDLVTLHRISTRTHTNLLLRKNGGWLIIETMSKSLSDGICRKIRPDMKAARNHFSVQTAFLAVIIKPERPGTMMITKADGIPAKTKAIMKHVEGVTKPKPMHVDVQRLDMLRGRNKEKGRQEQKKASAILVSTRTRMRAGQEPQSTKSPRKTRPRMRCRRRTLQICCTQETCRNIGKGNRRCKAA